MEFRRLGRSGLQVSEISLGNWISHTGKNAQETAIACVRAALDNGITTFDTADSYAESQAETLLGQALAHERRDALVVCTKVYYPTGDGRNDRGLSRKHIMSSINCSLSRLRSDYVDLYQAHRYDHTTPIEETMQAFADVVRSGKALYIGVSEWRAEQLRAAHALAKDLKIPLISNQPQYSMIWRIIEDEVIPAADDLGIGQIVWSPVGQGVLTGKYLPGQSRPARSRAATVNKSGVRFMRQMLADDTLRAVQELRPLAQDAGLSMAQLAIAWVLQNPAVSSAIIGASQPHQVHENTKASGVRLSRDVLIKIDEVLGAAVIRDPTLTHSPPEPPYAPHKTGGIHESG
jgi:aryl-alcohol dehydrogenase-like predicted oxidoreductase